MRVMMRVTVRVNVTVTMTVKVMMRVTVRVNVTLTMTTGEKKEKERGWEYLNTKRKNDAKSVIEQIRKVRRHGFKICKYHSLRKTF
jgi:regulator of replication initiation timing